MKKCKDGYGWAWEISDGKDWVLCHYAEPTKIDLERDGKPSPEARPVSVRIVKKLKKRTKT